MLPRARSLSIQRMQVAGDWYRALHTYVLHPFNVGLDLLHYPGIPLHLLRALHAFVYPLSHLLDVPLGV